MFAGTPGESAQRGLNFGLLLFAHLFKHDAHAEDSKAATRMQVKDFAMQFAATYAIADAQTQFRLIGDRFERIDIATAGAQFGNLGENTRSVAKSNFGIREEREPRIGAPYCIRTVSHNFSPARERRNPLYRTAEQ